MGPKVDMEPMRRRREEALQDSVSQNVNEKRSDPEVGLTKAGAKEEVYRV